MKKKILGIVLTIMMVVSLFPFTAFSAKAEGAETECLNFTAVNGRVSIQLSQFVETLDYNLEYKINDGSWKQWNDPETNAVDIPKDGTIYLRKSGEEVATVFGRTFVMEAKDEGATVIVAGNVMSLLDKTCASTTTMGERCFEGLFYSCDILTSASDMLLPATKLAGLCYMDMFGHCTALNAGPQLPATKLEERCYEGMFYDCGALETAPALPATELAQWCYDTMFWGCSKLEVAPDLPATTLAAACYFYMFAYCESLETAPALPAMKLAPSCYTNMFYCCTDLTTAPALPATELVESCYEYMFAGCTSLVAAPSLPAKTLKYNSYSKMFQDCSSLSKIKIEAENWNDGSKATFEWVKGVPSEGTFICSSGLVSSTKDSSHVPEGWTVKVGNKVNTNITGEGMVKASSTIAAPLESVTFTATPISDEYILKNGFPQVVSHEGGHNISLTTNTDGSYTFEMPQYESGVGYDVTIYAEFIKVGEVEEFNITATGGNVMVNIAFRGQEIPSNQLQYKIGNMDWEDWGFATDVTNYKTLTLTIPKDEKLYLRKKEGVTEYFGGTFNFSLPPETEATVSVAGNIMTLLDSSGESLHMNPSCFEDLFKDCTLLTTAENLYLPATELVEQCYYWMFYGCSSLTKAPALPATTLAKECYWGMFQSCSSLITAPVLPATDLADGCYKQMFYKCTALQETPNLPATKLEYACYSNMFYGCTSLVVAHDIPATTLAVVSCTDMFSGCTMLTKAPALPATELAEACYIRMFQNCTSLLEAPDLPATELARWCYANMFDGCKLLNKIKVGFINWYEDISATGDWVKDVANEGNFICSNRLDMTKTDSSHVPSGWNQNIVHEISTHVTEGGSISTSDFLGVVGKEITFTATPLTAAYVLDEGFPTVTTKNLVKVEVTKKAGSYSFIMPDDDVLIDAKFVDSEIIKDCVYLNFTATGGTVKIGFSEEYGELVVPNYKLQYKIDDGQWSIWTDMAQPIELEPNKKLYLRKYGTAAKKFGGRFKMTPVAENSEATVEVAGNIMSLIDDTCVTREMAPSCFKDVFSYCTILKSAENLSLPAMTLYRNCYDGMFESCTLLEKGPKLPATVMADGCYLWMFAFCRNLKEAPKLPATTLADESYAFMFYDCEALKSAPTLPATTLGRECYYEMFTRCTSLTSAPALPATTLADGCYESMFQDCTALTSAPKLPAMTMKSRCYCAMFNGCTELVSAPSLPAMTLADDCYSWMFIYCSKLEKAPDLPANTLVSKCYAGMFYDCPSLSNIRVGFNNWLETNTNNKISCATENWVNGVASSGTFICPAGLETKNDTSHIPEGWEKQNGFKITISTTENGIVEADTLIAKQGELISFTITPSVGYVIKQGFPTVTYVETGETINLEYQKVEDKYQFTMPEADVTIACEFEEIGFYWGYDSSEKTLYLSGTEVEGCTDEGDGKGLRMSYEVDLTAGQPWMEDNLALEATKVVIQSEVRPESTAGWFKNMVNLTSISNLDKIIGQESMESMFEGCKSLVKIETTKLDTRNTTDMKNMFKGCEKLTALDLGSFDMEDVTDTTDIIEGCTSLAEIRTPKNLKDDVSLPAEKTWYDEKTEIVTKLPKKTKTIHEYTLTVYEVSFDANGGSGDMLSVKVAKPYGEDCVYTLPTAQETTFTPPEENKYVAGWGIKNEGEITPIVGTTYTLTKDVTLYTIWGTDISSFEIYKINKAAECEDMKEASDTTEITDKINAAIQAIEGLEYDYDKTLPENRARVDEIVEPLKAEVYAIRLAQAKKNAKAEIDIVAGAESGQSTAVKILVTDAKNSIDSASTLEKVESRKDRYIKKILDKAAEEATKIINEAAGNKPSVAVKAIVEQAIELISEAGTVPEINEIRDDALERIYKQRQKEGLDKYEIIKGADSNFYLSDPKDMQFISNAPYGKFIMVLIDDREVSESNYTVKEGSTIVTLKADYIKNLRLGKHSVTIVSNDGKGSANFNIYEYKPLTGDINDPMTWVLIGIAMLLLIAVIIVYELRSKAKKNK